MNRHYHSEAPSVWASYEYLIKERLESIDHMARRMFSELQYTGMRKDDIYAFMEEQFTELWKKVAAEQEAITNGRKPR